MIVWRSFVLATALLASSNRFYGEVRAHSWVELVEAQTHTHTINDVTRRDPLQTYPVTDEGSGDYSSLASSHDEPLPILWQDDLTANELKLNRMADSFLQYITSDGLPEPFRRAVDDYLQQLARLLRDRLKAMANNTTEILECAHPLPNDFYRINLDAFQSLMQCMDECTSAVLEKYFDELHAFATALIACMDEAERMSK